MSTPTHVQPVIKPHAHLTLSYSAPPGNACQKKCVALEDMTILKFLWVYCRRTNFINVPHIHRRVETNYKSKIVSIASVEVEGLDLQVLSTDFPETEKLAVYVVCKRFPF